MRFSDLTTPAGYNVAEVASALQKTIRRGAEREALFWATELDIAGFGGYVFKRLRTIASEDVGLADPLACVVVRALYENWLEARKGKRVVEGEPLDGNWIPGTRLFLVQAVIYLARAKKSRMIDHAVMTLYEGERPALPIPDYALDRHTARGARMGRGQDHFFDEGAQIENAAPLPDPYAVEGRAARTAPKSRGHEQTQLPE